ncbi:hypothetical protein IE077_004229 [Cardiosporidium cionae]|uniref:SANT domain-containing protein n=1 Tax=Cardiosporidium cionae TaxID=476202 RepID=A0ABQ7JDL2_9APIC|nr:hypothetical protein IE077_004229 [Cardiosporidium cionae]|eukprot:KAF8822033.1 hypothetical protein IE077_004229 [Cardiosporidium cionae]
MEDVEGTSTCEKTSILMFHSPGTETRQVVVAPSTISLSTVTIGDTSVSEDEKLEKRSIKDGPFMLESNAAPTDDMCASNPSAPNTTQCLSLGNLDCFYNSVDRAIIANVLDTTSGIHTIEKNLQAMSKEDLPSNAVAEETQQLIEQLPFSVESSCKIQSYTVKEELIHENSNVTSSSSIASRRMHSDLVNLNATTVTSARPEKSKYGKDLDLPSDSDSTTSLVSRVKNPKKRRTTRVEYRPRARVSSYRVRATVSVASSRHRFGRKHLAGRVEQGRGRIGTLRRSRLPLRDARTSRDCKRRPAMRRCQRPPFSNIASCNLVIGNDMQLKYATTYHNQSVFEGNHTKFSDKMCEILKNQDEFDVEIENIIDLKNGIDMKDEPHHSDEKPIAASISQNLLMSESTLNEISNISKIRGDSDIKPGYEGIELPGSDVRTNRCNDSSNSESSVVQRGVRKRLQFPLRDSSNKSEATGILRRKRLADCRIKGDEEMENPRIIKTKIGQESNSKSVSAFAADAFLPASFNLNNADGSSLAAQGDTNQRFSARLRQIQTQKSVFSLNSTVNSFLKNGHQPETKLSCRSPIAPTCLFPLYGNVTTAAGQNPLQLAPDGLAFYDTSSTCPLISPEARDDPIIRERYDFAKNKMKKVEDFLETCETMYFGKSINIRNDPLYSKQCSRSLSTVSSTVRSSRNTISQFNEIGKLIDPSLLLIRNLILSNNRLHSDSKVSQMPATVYDGKGTTKITQSLVNCQSLCNPNKSLLSTYTKISPLEILSSPLRKPHVLDGWGPKEVCLFEAAICKYGKDFSKIQRIIQTKTTKDMIDFYYLWKKTNRYVAWKEFRCLSETMPVNFFE